MNKVQAVSGVTALPAISTCDSARAYSPGHPSASKTSGLAALVAESGRYFLVSVVALVLDYGLLIGLTGFVHINYLVSAGIGFAAGLALGYCLSTAFVFRERRLTNRWIEVAGFALLGILGLLLNESLMKLFVEWCGLHYAVAKIPVAGIGFVFNYATRRLLLFTKGRSQDQENEANSICRIPLRPLPSSRIN